VRRLEDLTRALLRLLCLAAAGYSSLAAWAVWCASETTNIGRLQSALDWSQRLDLPTASIWISLADLLPDREEEYLQNALLADPRHPRALARLAVLAEFANNPARAQRLLDQLTTHHRAYRSFTAAAAQAARAGNIERRDRFAALALRYCPRDADEIFALYSEWSDFAGILNGSPEPRRTDYLRYLIGAQRYHDALYFQVHLPKSEANDAHRLELSERFLLAKDFANAAALFERVHEDWTPETIFNRSFRTQPKGIGFDWRISQSPALRTDWHPGTLLFDLGTAAQDLELMSIFVPGAGTPDPPIPSWHGDLHGLSWRVEALPEGARRLSLWARSGPPRRITLREVRLP
jgi:hypothetical protein